MEAGRGSGDGETAVEGGAFFAELAGEEVEVGGGLSSGDTGQDAAEQDDVFSGAVFEPGVTGRDLALHRQGPKYRYG